MFSLGHKSTNEGKGLVAIDTDSKISSTFVNLANINKD